MNLNNVIKIAFASRKATLGQAAVLNNIYTKKAALVILASDAGKSTIEKTLKSATKQKIEVIHKYTKAELGQIVKGYGEIAVLSINDRNLIKIKGVK